MATAFDTGRIEAFSDGVFAIAITLLVLEIAVPPAEFDDLWRGIARQWPSYLAYATSFWTVGGLWVIHHGIFRRMRLADGNVMRINLLLLMTVSFLPFPTKLMAEALHEPSAEEAAVLFYGAALFFVTGLTSVLGRYVASRDELRHEDITRAELLAGTENVEPSLAFYAVVIVLALLAPQVAAFGFLVIAVSTVLGPWRTRGPRPGR